MVYVESSMQRVLSREFSSRVLSRALSRLPSRKYKLQMLAFKTLVVSGSLPMIGFQSKVSKVNGSTAWPQSIPSRFTLQTLIKLFDLQIAVSKINEIFRPSTRCNWYSNTEINRKLLLVCDSLKDDVRAMFWEIQKKRSKKKTEEKVRKIRCG